jgi:hypothetical protein
MFFLDDLIRALWKWWLSQRRIKRFREWNPTSATVATCGVIDDTCGERLQLTFRYEVNGEQFRGLIVSKKRPTGTTLRLEDDVLEGRTVVIRMNPSDAASSGVLNEDNPQWPWTIEE